MRRIVRVNNYRVRRRNNVLQRKKMLLNYINAHFNVRPNQLKTTRPLPPLYKKAIHLKSVYHSVIPLNIFQTWHTKNLTPSMHFCMSTIKNNNPKFNYELFDDNDCREFIKNNYSSEVLNAFDTLIPGAFKADLWRYCILYKRGGIYLDIKYNSVNQFKFINLTESEHWVLDADDDGIYNALMVVKAGNDILRKAIDLIVENVKNNYYGSSCLEPTGPKLLSKFFSNKEKNNFDMKHKVFLNMNNRVILYKGIQVFKSYPGYLNDYDANKKTDHYSTLWSNRKIYKKNISTIPSNKTNINFKNFKVLNELLDLSLNEISDLSLNEISDLNSDNLLKTNRDEFEKIESES